MSEENTGISTSTTTTTIKETIDTNISAKLTPMLLNGKNYQSWARTTHISVKDKGKLGFINDTKQKPTTPTEAEEWELQDSVIISWLLHSMESNISEHFCYKKPQKSCGMKCKIDSANKITMHTYTNSEKSWHKIRKTKDYSLNYTAKYKRNGTS
jgi:gag-polypeptide of LTR copia-type